MVHFSEPTTHAPDNPVVDPANPSEEEDPNNGAEVYDPSDDEDSSVVEDEVVEPPSHSSWNRSLPVVDSAPEIQEDIPKKSYASIVSLLLFIANFILCFCICYTFTYLSF